MPMSWKSERESHDKRGGATGQRTTQTRDSATDHRLAGGPRLVTVLGHRHALVLQPARNWIQPGEFGARATSRVRPYGVRSQVIEGGREQE